MSALKWLLIGTGDIANKRVAPALADAENSELVAVCDVNRSRAEELAGKMDVNEVYDDLDAALENTDADAVYLATPIWLHADQAVAAIKADKHVLVEKPLALNRKDADKVVEALNGTGLTAGCAYYRRRFNRYEFTKKMLDNGVFGEVVGARMTYFSWFAPEKDDPKYWRVVREKSGGGPLSDMGTHMFDVLIGLFGLPVKVTAKCANQTNAWDVEDGAAIIMELRNGALVTASFNWNSKTWRHEFEVFGTEAKIDWLPYDSGPVTKTVGRDIQSVEMNEHENVHLPLVQDFVDAVHGGREPVCSLIEARKTNILLDAVYESAAKNQEVTL